MKLLIKYRSPLRAAFLGMLVLMMTSRLDAQASGSGGGRDIHLKIATDRQTYRLGDSIRIRLRLHNVSSHPVRFIHDSPAGLARLKVFDAAGDEIKPTRPRSQRGRSGRPVTLEPGKEAGLNWQGHDWLDLRDWGYDLRMSGTYTIIAVPGVVGPELPPDDQTVRSNRVTFQILP